MGNLKTNMTKEEWWDFHKEIHSHSDQVIDIMNKDIMKGKLSKVDGNWIISYTEDDTEKEIPLHYIDVDFFDKAELVFDNMQARVNSLPEVSFRIIEQQKLTGVSKYGKLNV